MDQTPRYLLSLGIENFKRIEVAFIPFGDAPGVHMITGANANGKSSVLDAIEALFAGKDALPPDAIHHGAERGRIRGHLGELIVIREITRKADGKLSSTLKVESADGASYGSPQSILEELYGRFTFDPLDFLRRPAREKYESLRRFVSGIDFELMERLHKGDFERRTDINREAKRLRAAAQEIAVPMGTPKVKVSIERLSKELERAGDSNAKRERALATIEEAGRRIREAEAEIARLQKVIADSHEVIKNTVLPDEIDTAELRRELTKANEMNRAVDLFIRRRDLEGMAEAEEKKSEALTKAMEERTAKINKAIEAAQMPYEGLALFGGQVLLGGVPFEQASSAEQWRACVGIAMAENPSLRTILVRQGSLLDSKSLRIIAEMASDRGYQVIVEKVDESGKVGIVMVEGAVESTPESRQKGVHPTELGMEAPISKKKGKRHG